MKTLNPLCYTRVIVFLITALPIFSNIASASDCVNLGEPYYDEPRNHIPTGDPYKRYGGDWYNTGQRGICGQNEEEWRRDYDLVQDLHLWATKYQDRKPADPDCPPSLCPRQNLGLTELGWVGVQFIISHYETDCKAIVKWA